MKLSSLTRSTPLEAVFEFGDFKIRLRHASRSDLQRLAQSCTTQRWDKGVRVSVLDDKKLAKEFGKLAVVGWEGLTIAKAAKLIPLDLSAVDPNTEVPFDLDNLNMLVEGNTALDRFIQETSVDLAAFQPDAGEELKNSEASQSGN